MIYRDVTATVGRTPAVELGRLAKGLPGRVVAKLEMRNPCGSVKDRLGAEVVLTPGILMGDASSGAALHAALAVASRDDAAGRTIVVFLADTGERYITTSLFAR